MSRPTSEELDLDSLVADYLFKKGYISSFNTFNEEIKTTSGFACTKLQLILNYFYSGDRAKFFSLWNPLIEDLTGENAICAHKLEFYFRVYFAIFPIHPVNPSADDTESLKTEIQLFKTFLETQGAQLSKTPEFLSFYALPYINDIKVFL